MSRSLQLRSSRHLWVVLAATAAACSGATPTTGPATQPTTLPSSVSLADARPLAELTPGDLQATFSDKLAPPLTADRAVYFGTVNAYDGADEDAAVTSALPILAVKDGDDWKAVPLVGRGLANTAWKYVGAGPRPREAWGVLDTTVGDGGPDLVLAHSTDGGQSFALHSIHKPCPQATVYDFLMNHDGHGRMTVSLDETVGRHRPGLYTFDTADFGQTWSPKPRFEPNAMVPSDSVPDDEQPDAGVDNGGKGKTELHGRGTVVRPVVGR